MQFDVGSIHEINNTRFHSSKILACKLIVFSFLLVDKTH